MPRCGSAVILMVAYLIAGGAVAQPQALSPTGRTLSSDSIRALGDEDERTRDLGRREIRRIGKPLLPLLLDATASKNDRIRRGVIELLGQMGSDADLAWLYAIEMAHDDPDSTVRSKAILAALQITYDVRGPCNLDEFPRDGKGSDIARLASSLLTCLRDPHDFVRADATQALGIVCQRTPPVIHALHRSLEDRSGFVRRSAAESLGRIGPDASEILPTLKRLVADTDPEVRAEAAFACWRIGNRTADALPTLVGILKTEPDKFYFDLPPIKEGAPLRSKAPGSNDILAVPREHARALDHLAEMGVQASAFLEGDWASRELLCPSWISAAAPKVVAGRCGDHRNSEISAKHAEKRCTG